jgi:hypothetical protein
MATVTGGDKLRARLDEIARLSNNASGVKVGFLAEATYPSGKSVAMIAAIQEFGAPRAGIPPRPFMRNAIAKHHAEWGPAMAQLLLDNGYDAFRTLQQAGEAISGQIRQSIIETNEPPLAESTLRKRGVGGMVYNPKDPKTFGAKPLIDTGNMLNSVNYEVQA